MAQTYQQQLDDIDADIVSVRAVIAQVSGSSNAVTAVGSLSFTRHSLPQLYEQLRALREQRKELAPLAAKETRGGRDIRRIAPFG